MEETHGSGNDVRIAWSAAREANRLNWDDRAPLHEEAYDAHRFAADPDASHVDHDLAVLGQHLPGGTIAGLDVLHLQCHIGTDTISLARRGARVTGIDFSPASLEVAARLAREASVEVTWVESDALAARSALRGDFDVVFTSVGALVWLSDLELWAEQIAALLRPGGVFYVRDGHPMLYALDESGEPLTVRNRYFANGAAQMWDDAGTYVGDGTTEHTRTYEWPHSLSEIIGSLLRAGLRLERFDEGQTLPWRWSPIMVPTDEGWVLPDHLRDKVPCEFTLVAVKP
ncbi:class I SAM-dependent methyltransferase [Propioniciclava sp.]|uniref:class I SAM-dependent methyltransferase n=1 Tax=Propioniciclava sp. TaxID=2038686 RepID=UPI00262B883E|nr:class I SAM-dependent methyltransferase [Propioniciclava sp.]